MFTFRKNSFGPLVLTPLVLCVSAITLISIHTARGTDVGPYTFGWYCAADGGCNGAITNECLNIGTGAACDWCDGFASENQCCPSYDPSDSCDDYAGGGTGNINSDDPCGQNWHGTCDGDNCNDVQVTSQQCSLTFCNESKLPGE